MSDYKQAIIQLKKGVDFLIKNNDPNLYECYNSLSDCYYQLADYDKVEHYALLSSKSCKVKTLQSTARINLLLAACRLKDRSKADSYMKELVELRNELHHFFPSNEIRFAEATIEYNLLCRNYVKAMAWTDSLKKESSASQYKALVYEMVGDYKKALQMERMNRQLVDSLRTQKGLEQMAFYSECYDNMKLSAEKNQLDLQNIQFKYDKIDNERRLLEARQEQNDLLLENNRLDLNNKDLTIAQHTAELKLKDATMLQQKQEQDKLRMMAQSQRQQRNAAFIVTVLIIISALIALFISSRFSKKVLREKMRAEKACTEAESARKEADNANRLKSLFLQNMSHEIRTPLNAIVGFSGLMNSKEISNEEKEEFAHLIEHNSDLLTTLVNDILDISKLESGTYKVDLCNTTVSEICENAFSSVKFRVPAGVELKLEVTTQHIELKTDKSRAVQVIINMLTNAFKNTAKGNVTLSTRLERDNVQFIVTDTGCGIPADKSELIFERFSKINSFTQGTGLGLNICKQICQLLNGSIVLNTSYTQGAEFIFSLPLNR